MLNFMRHFESWNQMGSFSSWDIDAMHTDNVNNVNHGPYFTFALYDTLDAPVQLTMSDGLMWSASLTRCVHVWKQLELKLCSSARFQVDFSAVRHIIHLNEASPVRQWWVPTQQAHPPTTTHTKNGVVGQKKLNRAQQDSRESNVFHTVVASASI